MSSQYRSPDLMVTDTLFSPKAQYHQTKEYGGHSPYPVQSQTPPTAILESVCRFADGLASLFSIQKTLRCMFLMTVNSALSSYP